MSQAVAPEAPPRDPQDDPAVEPTTLAYGVLPTSHRGRLICAAVFAALLLAAIGIVGHGPINSIDIEGTRIEFRRPGLDGALPQGPGLGAWNYTAGSWTVDGGAVGTSSEAGVTFATLTAPKRSAAESKIGVLADGAGMVFRYRDSSNYWGVRAVPSYGSWNVFKVVEGRETIVRILAGQALDGTRVGVQQSGTRMRIILNGLVRSTIEDEDLAGAAGVGLMAPAGNDAARFDSLTLGTFDGTIALREGDDEQDEIVPSLNPGGT
ncbi:MAG: hypothetical protein JWM47_3134 [Acidimicrobiales bacterium]|nr:hypothetical protein [Acidimicrobiales bacterium]